MVAMVAGSLIAAMAFRPPASPRTEDRATTKKNAPCTKHALNSLNLNYLPSKIELKTGVQKIKL